MRALCFGGTLTLVGMLALVGALLLAATICVLTLGINGLLTTTTT